MENLFEKFNSLYLEVEQLKKISNASFFASSYQLRKDVSDFFDTYQMDMKESILDIIDNKKSVARFGDGEMRLIFNPFYKISFQKNSYELGLKLKEVLTFSNYNPDKLMVCLPKFLPADVFQNILYAELWPSLSNILSTDVMYGSTHITRPLIFQFMREEAIKLWRDVWKDRNVLIVTGKGSRFVLEGDLFSSAKKIRMLYTQPENAFEYYEKIRDEITASVVKNELVLLSLGPTATILAAELSNLDIQAIDLGHITSSYLNVFKGGIWPESLPMKNIIEE